jgi:predicted TIM-barrel fold metal-dependent hydrolase
MAPCPIFIIALLLSVVAAQQNLKACWPALPRIIDAHVHLVSTDNNISYTWAAPPLPNMSCPCVFPLGLPCLCPWTYAHYKNASRSSFPHPSMFKIVFVEVAARPEQWLFEARWVQSLADEHAVPVGAIVAGAPVGFGSSGADDRHVSASLDELAALPLARGIRAAALNFSDPDAFQAIVKHTAMLAARQLSLDVITAVHTPGTATAIARLAAAVPDVTIIVNHMGSPDVHNSSLFDSWVRAIAEIALHENVFVKVGGLLQQFKADGKLPSAEQQAPFVQVSLQNFGFGRSLFESNWFFINWAGRMDVYEYWLTSLNSMLNASYEQLQQLFFSSSATAYRIHTA